MKIVGGLGIRRQLNVGGIATISDPTQSTSLTTGALKILYGGVGVSKQLNVGGMTSILDVTPSAGFGPLSGALKVSGGAGIGMNVNVGLTLGVNKTTNFKNGLTLFEGLFVNSTNPYIATFRNTNGANNGISIQIASSSPKRINNYVGVQTQLRWWHRAYMKGTKTNLSIKIILDTLASCTCYLMMLRLLKLVLQPLLPTRWQQQQNWLLQRLLLLPV